jgi:FkbM family methyltransferase
LKKCIPISIHNQNIFIRPKSHDLEVAFTSLGREFRDIEFLLPNSYNGIIVDAGGYIGTAAIKLSTMYPSAQIVSLEPSIENFEILSLNTADYKNIDVINAALVGSEIETVQLFDRKTGEWGFSVISNPEDNQNPELLSSVKCINIKKIKEIYNKDIGILKLDIEGGEKEIFDSDSSDIKQIKVIFVEIHDYIVKGTFNSFKTFSSDRLVFNFGGEKYLSISKN